MPSPITPEDAARFPAPGLAVANSFAFSPDGRYLTYLWNREQRLSNDLYAFDIEEGREFVLATPPEGGITEENLSLEQQLRRERMRQLTRGIIDYEWSQKGGRLLIPLRHALYVIDEPGGSPRELFSANGEHPPLDAHFSPDGQWVSFVRERELFVMPAEGGEPRQLTSGAGEEGLSNGLAEFVAQEEMDRKRGYWWSPDSRHIAFAHVDERHIPLFTIVHQGEHQAFSEHHRYPFAGEANAIVRLGVVPLAGGKPVWMDLGPDDDIYLARVQWLPDGRLTAQIENREQSELKLLVFDPASGRAGTLLTERSDVWINLHKMFQPLEDGRFIWASERSSFMHLYLYNRQGDLIRPLTSGEWLVTSLEAVDEANGMVYLTATKESPLETHLYSVSLDGGEITKITHDAGDRAAGNRAAGTHAVKISPDFKYYVNAHQALDKAPAVTLRALEDNRQIARVAHAPDSRLETLDLAVPEQVALQNRHGDTLYGLIYKPDPAFGNGPYPTIISLYGGPHAQLVTNSWLPAARMWAQLWRGMGYLVFTLDNRGSARRGLAFEGVLKHNMGDLEVQDQVDGVRWLVEQGLTDPERVGVIGWSYGGYMACMCLARAPETFKVAVAGAPVASYAYYDTHYTERYMGTPQSNPEGYRSGSVLSHVDKIKGRLMLVHGLLDENVHFRHTARIIDALTDAGIPYELVLLPDARHSPRKLSDREYELRRMAAFFEQNL